ncbi:hypothetical protein M885DRAFT_202217 [Pelagophyceae sp. CCMP2097]|nr:hypothetical protein M885DRAFT_202217 [Pelagophyceae sp. CCMP2097]
MASPIWYALLIWYAFANFGAGRATRRLRGRCFGSGPGTMVSASCPNFRLSRGLVEPATNPLSFAKKASRPKSLDRRRWFGASLPSKRCGCFGMSSVRPSRGPRREAGLWEHPDRAQSFIFQPE